MRRRPTITGVLLVTGLLTAMGPLVAPSAGAHTGETVHSGVAGPYLVIATGDTVTVDGREGIRYSIALHDNDAERPVTDAEIAVTATADDGEVIGPVDATSLGNAYDVFIPDEGKTRWEVVLDIDAPQGPSTVEHAMHGLAVSTDGESSDSSGSNWLYALVPILVIGGAVAVVLLRRGRGADHDDPGRSSRAPAHRAV